MGTNTLLDLAARCEAAEGPDRELADEVLYALGFTKDTKRRPPPRGGTRQTWRLPKGRHVSISFDPTASLDAAMTLVPEGCSVSIEAIVCGDESRCIQADVWSGARPELAMAEVWSTPALALCAAALRARASQ